MSFHFVDLFFGEGGWDPIKKNVVSFMLVFVVLST